MTHWTIIILLLLVNGIVGTVAGRHLRNESMVPLASSGSFADNAIFDLPSGYPSIEEYLTKNQNKEITLAGMATYTTSGFLLLDVQRRNGAEKSLVVIMGIENNKWPEEYAGKRLVVTGTITEEKVKIKTQSSEVLPVLYKWVLIDPKVRLYSVDDQAVR